MSAPPTNSSIAYGCAVRIHAAGAELAVTYVNAKAEPHVRPLCGKRWGATIIVPCDMREPGQLEAVFDRIAAEWSRLDFLFHSIAFAPRDDLRTGLVNCTADRLRHCDGCLMPFLHPHGEAFPAVDARRREFAARNVLWSRPCDRELQSQWAGQ